MILKIFLVWRLGLLLATYLGSKIFQLYPNGGLGAVAPGKDFDFWFSWAQWDGGHFYNIAKFGYFEPNQYAFFPLYPLLIKITSYLTFGNLLLAGLIVSNLAFLLFLYVFYNLVKSKFNKDVALSGTITILTFPTAYFAVAMYSEAVFLLLVAFTFLYLQRKNYFLASIIAGASALTRLVGLALAISVLITYLEEIKFSLKRINLKILTIFLSVTPFAAYCAYLYSKFKDPFYFSTVQVTWHRAFTNPLVTIYSYFAINPFNKPFNDYLDLLLTILFLVILALGHKKIPIARWVFSLFAIIIPASTGTLTSMPRYLLSALGVFALIGYYLKDKKSLAIFLWGLSLLLQIMLAIWFVTGRWTA